MTTGSPRHRDFLAPQIGQAMDRRIRVDQDRLGLWRRCFLGQIDKLRVGRLGEHGYGIGNPGQTSISSMVISRRAQAGNRQCRLFLRMPVCSNLMQICIFINNDNAFD